MEPLTDLHQSKRGLAVVIACLVQTLNETDPTLQERFIARLEAAHRELRNNPPTSDKNNHMALEPLSWVRQFLTGWNVIDGQGEPFLSGYRPK